MRKSRRSCIGSFTFSQYAAGSLEQDSAPACGRRKRQRQVKFVAGVCATFCAATYRGEFRLLASLVMPQ